MQAGTVSRTLAKCKVETLVYPVCGVSVPGADRMHPQSPCPKRRLVGLELPMGIQAAWWVVLDVIQSLLVGVGLVQGSESWT